MKIAHPWHGVSEGDEFPLKVNAYIELTPFDTVKYELDKASGILKIDRPQQYSNLCPVLYGFVPRTYCGKGIGKLSTAEGEPGIKGDGDPLDICVLSERPIQHNNILLRCIPIGGFRMIDNNEADDKIIAVLKDDPIYGNMKELSELPDAVLNRILHYFKTYKLNPGELGKIVEIKQIYKAAESHVVLETAAGDYRDEISLKI